MSTPPLYHPQLWLCDDPADKTYTLTALTWVPNDCLQAAPALLSPAESPGIPENLYVWLPLKHRGGPYCRQFLRPVYHELVIPKAKTDGKQFIIADVMVGGGPVGSEAIAIAPGATCLSALLAAGGGDDFDNGITGNYLGNGRSLPAPGDGTAPWLRRANYDGDGPWLVAAVRGDGTFPWPGARTAGVLPWPDITGAVGARTLAGPSVPPRFLPGEWPVLIHRVTDGTVALNKKLPPALIIQATGETAYQGYSRPRLVRPRYELTVIPPDGLLNVYFLIYPPGGDVGLPSTQEHEALPLVIDPAPPWVQGVRIHGAGGQFIECNFDCGTGSFTAEAEGGSAPPQSRPAPSGMGRTATLFTTATSATTTAAPSAEDTRTIAKACVERSADAGTEVENGTIVGNVVQRISDVRACLNTRLALVAPHRYRVSDPALSGRFSVLASDAHIRRLDSLNV